LTTSKPESEIRTAAGLVLSADYRLALLAPHNANKAQQWEK
jgi:hypothetical protein